MILSFSITSKLAKINRVPDPLVSGLKTVSRRVWSDRTGSIWIKAYRNGRITHDAWSSAPYVKGARKIGTFSLIQEPYPELLKDMPEEDLESEGGFWRDRNHFICDVAKGNCSQVVWVVRWKDFSVY